MPGTAAVSLRVAAAGVAAALLITPPVASAELVPGDLDPAFGTGGVVIVEPSLAIPQASSAGELAVDAQGRLLLAGQASDANGRPAAWVGRLLAGGTVDPSFGTGWRSVFQLGVGGTGPNRPFSTASDVFLTAGGKVGLVPYRIANEDSSGASLLRLRNDGQADPDHGTAGLGSLPAPAPPAEHLAAAGVANDDGGAFLGGSWDNDDTAAGGRQAAWWRLDAFGQPLTMPGGTRLTLEASQAPNASDRYTSISDMVRLASGKTLVAGTTTWTDTRSAGFVAQLLPSGALDTVNFGATGPGYTVVQARDPSGPAAGDSSFTSVAVGPSGAIYAAGSADDGSGARAFSVVRLGPGGVIDPSFGSQGIRRIQLAEGASEFRRSDAQQVLVQDDGRPVLVGNVDHDGDTATGAVVRLLPSGALDQSFGAGGIRFLPEPGGRRLTVGDATLAPYGRLSLAGTVIDGGGLTSAAAVRMTLEPIADLPPRTPPRPGAPGLTPPPAATRPSAPPRLSGLRVSFTSRRVPTVRFVISEAARVTVLVERVRKGRRRGRRCVPGARRGPRCTTFTRISSTTASVGAGAQSVRAGTVALRARAQYRFTLTARGVAGVAAAPLRTTVKVPAPKARRRR